MSSLKDLVQFVDDSYMSPKRLLTSLLIDMNQTHGTTMLISSHDLDNVVDVCSRIAILEEGEIVRDEEKTDRTYHELKDYFKLKV